MNMKKNRDAVSESKEAYWISPEGEIFTVHTSHIDMVFDRPELFGLNLQFIHSVYDIYNEKYRSEGKGREEILIMLFRQGWIRVRRYLKPYRWTINVNTIDEKTSYNLKKTAAALINKGHSEYDEVILDTEEGEKLFTLSEIAEVGSDLLCL
jgi:hypothetical protein